MIVDEQETAFGQTADILLKQGGFADSPGSVQMEQSPIGKIGMLLHGGQQVAAAYEERFGSLGQPVLNLHSIPVTPDFRSIILNGNSRRSKVWQGREGKQVTVVMLAALLVLFAANLRIPPKRILRG